MKQAFILTILLFGLSIVVVSQIALSPTETQLVAVRQFTRQIIQIPTRKGVTESFELLQPQNPVAVAILFTGGNGRVNLTSTLDNKNGNFLIRSRELFAKKGLVVVSFAPPSDRKYLTGFRESSKHVQDIEAVMVWLRQKYTLPLWLVGTSNGTLSVAFAAIKTEGSNGPDGIVLTSTVLDVPNNGPSEALPVPYLALDKLAIPVLVVHHKFDGCRSCDPRNLPNLMAKLKNATRKELLVVTGGTSVGNPCQPAAYHGYNGIEEQVVDKIFEWMTSGVTSSPPSEQGS